MPRSKATPSNLILQVVAREEPEVAEWCCPSCRSLLDLSQPSAQNPDSLLGTCPSCDAWYLFYMSPTTGNYVILRVPNADEVNSALAPPESAPAGQARPPRASRRSGPDAGAKAIGTPSAPPFVG